MTTHEPARPRILGSLSSADGKGVVRMEDRFDTDIDDLWSAITEPQRLARWLGDVEGDLHVGGEFRAHFFASGWAGMGRIEACERPHRMFVLTKMTEDADKPYDHSMELILTVDGEGTTLVWEERGMPVEQVAAYGGGIQVHVEDLAAYIGGRGPIDAAARWKELEPSYRQLAADAGLAARDE